MNKINSNKNDENKQIVWIYTDGGCRGNPGIGGWGGILKSAGCVREISGHALETTNNRMELTAAVEALKLLKRPCKVYLTTDSQYVRLGMTQWIKAWKKNGWKNSKKELVKNKDLWELLDELCDIHEVHWFWVKGHAGHPENERADVLANLAMDRLKR